MAYNSFLNYPDTCLNSLIPFEHVEMQTKSNMDNSQIFEATVYLQIGLYGELPQQFKPLSYLERFQITVLLSLPICF